MKKRWSLNIEDFGKIKNAKIEISPLMLFVGDNNSGKSYVMSLLWGILALGRLMFDFKSSSIESYKKCDEWLQGNLGKEDLIVDDTIQNLFVDWFNVLLKQNKKLLINNIFNYPIEINQIYISDYQRSIPLRIKWDQNGNRYSSKENEIRFPLPNTNNLTFDEKSKMLSYICWNLLMHNLTSPLFPAYSAKRASGEPIYLPASRTGFMLTYKTLVQNVIGMQFNSLDNATTQYRSTFTLPIAYFLQNLVGLTPNSNGKYSDVAHFLEREVMRGNVKSDEAPIPNYSFKPKDARKELPLHVTSSLVAELTPLVIFLNAPNMYKVLIIEEPESHLHPQLQAVVATAIVKLVNKGLPVWLTTHSDTLFQQMNNLIKLNNHPLREDLARKLGYEEIDFLQPDVANVYQFKVKETGKTEITKLGYSEHGFAIPSFNESLINLTNETILLQENPKDYDE